MHRRALPFLATALTCLAQTPAFEVASIKPSERSAIGGYIGAGNMPGPNWADPARYICNYCSPMMLIMEAWNLPRVQISAPPALTATLDTTSYNITAKVPPNTTRADLRLMQQNLLAERFGLTVRFDRKPGQVYDLTVAPTGHKMKPTPELNEPAPAPPASARLRIGPDGFPLIGVGQTINITMNGNTKHQAVGEDMAQFRAYLADLLNKPVTDSTSLTGRYDFILVFDASSAKGRQAPPPPPGGTGTGTRPFPMETDSAPTLLRALRDQLGLRAEPKQGLAEVLVVEHIEKSPTAN